MMTGRLFIIGIVIFALAACGPGDEAPSIDVAIVVDGKTVSLSLPSIVSVDQLLASAQIELGPQDRISHPLVAQVEANMMITIRRVREKEVCDQQEIAFERLLQPKEGVPAGGQRVGRIGKPGIEEACYRVTLEDDKEVERVLIDKPLLVRAPIDEIIYTGTTATVTPVAIAGRLSYINHGNAWTIEDNTVNKRQLTTSHNLDSLVFHQNEAGTLIIFSGETDATDDFFNELWLVASDRESEALRLSPTDVLFAEWRPRSSNTIAYSTGERSVDRLGWKALNNLWLMTIDLESGRTLTIEEALPESSGGLFGWWGTHFAWSPLGNQLAWARPDGFGLVDFERKRLIALADYAVFKRATDWIWLTSLSWSHEGQLLAVVIHGLPQADEPAETSPVFDVLVSSADGRFAAEVKAAAGMWAAPSFSPGKVAGDGDGREGFLAWLQAREPRNSMNSEYDLVVADRDGSNERRLFPPAGADGMLKHDHGLTPKDYAWSPDARHIAAMYRGDLWLVDVGTAEAHQLTFDGASSNPVWTG
ncbi:MAG: G5 domain-containing protein [Anaerolineae bacterium]|nr:G5 domain-containing protein [Anaerolineae bacterium]